MYSIEYVYSIYELMCTVKPTVSPARLTKPVQSQPSASRLVELVTLFP